jgi:hypothetical protein
MDRRMYGEDAFLDPCSKLLWDTSSANYPTTFVSLTEQVIEWFTKWSQITPLFEGLSLFMMPHTMCTSSSYYIFHFCK